MTNRRHALQGAAAISLAACLPEFALAQARSPKFIIPFAAGGGGDTLGRLMLTPTFANFAPGVPAIFENIAGAGGNVGAVAALKTDNVFLYGTNGTHAINQTLYSKPGFNAQTDFEPISRLSRIALIAVVRPTLDVKNIADLVKLLKANPGKFNYGSVGNGTTSHLAMEIFKAQAGLHAVHVPYRTGSQAMTDLIAGQVDLMIDISANVAPHIKSGRLRALAVSTASRAPGFEELPTIAESGVASLKSFDVSAWDALFAPKGNATANPQTIDTMNQAIRTALSDPKLKEQLQSRGATPSPTSPEELKKFIATEHDRWAIAIKRSGAQVD